MSDRFTAIDVIARITPEDGAEWVELNDKGQMTACGPIRADWTDICKQAADYFMAQRKWMSTEDALKEALVFRKQLLSNNGDKNDG